MIGNHREDDSKMLSSNEIACRSHWDQLMGAVVRHCHKERVNYECVFFQLFSAFHVHHSPGPFRREVTLAYPRNPVLSYPIDAPSPLSGTTNTATTKLDAVNTTEDFFISAFPIKHTDNVYDTDMRFYYEAAKVHARNIAQDSDAYDYLGSEPINGEADSVITLHLEKVFSFV